MNIWNISVRNFLYKPLYSFLSILMLSVSIALLIGIRQMDEVFRNQMEDNLASIDMVIGAKGSPLQLVLSSVLHIDNPTGNIPLEEVRRLVKNPMIKTWVPLSFGDNYQGYKIVGTNNDFASLYNANLASGRLPQHPMEVVLGAAVARNTGLVPGSSFFSSHGLAESGGQEHSQALTVTGVYEPTFKVLDRLIVTNLETIWDVHNHDHHQDEPPSQKDAVNSEQRNEDHLRNPEEHHHKETASHDEQHGHDESAAETHKNEEEDRDITAALISFRNPMALLTVPRRINENSNMLAALPKYELERLSSFTGLGVKTVTWIAYAILFISCITIFISLYRMVRDRAFDLALMRSYGASVFQLVKMVVYEGLLIAVLAFLIGALMSQAGLYFIFKMIMDQYKQQLPLGADLNVVFSVFGLMLLMVFFSIAFAVYPILRMNISKTLSHEK